MARDIVVEDAEEVRPDSLANGVVIMTTIILLGAVFLMQKGLKDHFNGGMMASKEAGAPR
jgi:hypothetical protein